MDLPKTAPLRLGNSQFFTDFPIDVLEKIERASVIRKFKKNTLIIADGDDSHSAYVLLNGSANAFTSDENGNEFIVNSFGKQDCFGELGLLDNCPRTANVITTTDCECVVIPRAVVIGCLESEPKAAMIVIRLLVERIRTMTEDVSSLALTDVYGRLVRLINASVAQTDEGKMMTERLTHKELANRVGSSREMISKILKDLRKGGYIEIENHRIVLLKALPSRW